MKKLKRTGRRAAMLFTAAIMAIAPSMNVFAEETAAETTEASAPKYVLLFPQDIKPAANPST